MFGPSLIPGGFAVSGIIEKFFDGSLTEVSTERLTIVDVRDVSRMHLDAVRKPEIKNERFIASSGHLFKKEIADIFAAEFGPKGFKVPTQEKEGERERSARISGDKAKAVFGEFYSPKDAVIQFAQTLIDLGVIKKHE